MAPVITVNGSKHTVQASPDTPLLYVLRNELNLRGSRFWVWPGPVRGVHGDLW
jgi:aerobic-type carbon monoxide dehydrogenase small subunit (CoxS/CutS family)